MSYPITFEYEKKSLVFDVEPFTKREFKVTLTEEYPDLPREYHFNAMKDRWIMQAMGPLNRTRLLKLIAQKIHEKELEAGNIIFFDNPEFELYEDYKLRNPNDNL